MPARIICSFACLIVVVTNSAAKAPLHQQIDSLILAKAKGQPVSKVADDAEFLRRIYLDLAGRIPTAPEARSFLKDASPDKRVKLIDKLLAGPDYARHMQEMFHVMLMERLGDHPEWTKYLQQSFAANKPWDQMAREILRGTPAKDAALKGTSFFYTKRLEKYGQNPTDYPGLTRDVGRLFLGLDLRCAQCHDHIFIDDYKQVDFQGMFAFFQNTYLQDAKNLVLGEKPTTKKMPYMSVFEQIPLATAPRIPGVGNIDIPKIEKGKEYVVAPDRKKRTAGELRFSPLAELAKKLPTPNNQAFRRNIANRLWYIMMGRGLVHPLDLHHSANPPSHPQLLDLLADEFVAHQFDIKWLLRELALSETYQRSSMLPDGSKDAPPAGFLTAIEKRLLPEQLMKNMLTATAQPMPKGDNLKNLNTRFHKAFAYARRQPEHEFNPSLKAVLFLLNDSTIQGWLQPKAGNLVDRLAKMKDASAVADEVYLCVLTRQPSAEERKVVADYLVKMKDRKVALGHLVWALMASTEFCVNH